MISWCPYLVAIIAFAHFGSCTDCYSCSSKEVKACNTSVHSLSKTHCDFESLSDIRKLASSLEPDFHKTFSVDTIPQRPFHCLKLVAKVSNQEETLRGCQIAQTNNEFEKDLDVCSRLTKEYNKQNSGRPVEILACELCNTDGCNSAPFSYLSTFTLLPVLLPYLFK